MGGAKNAQRFLRDIGGSSEFEVPLLRELSSLRRLDMMCDGRVGSFRVFFFVCFFWCALVICSTSVYRSP